ncbi:MAG: hypothetical protein CME98_10235 [Hyphomonas sp.]|nr:hypothetical protein [Hyphomonas sp.]
MGRMVAGRTKLYPVFSPLPDGPAIFGLCLLFHYFIPAADAPASIIATAQANLMMNGPTNISITTLLFLEFQLRY